MAADTAAPAAVLGGVMTDQRRSLLLWSVALSAIATMYISFYPLMGVEDMAAMVENLPEAMVNAFGYDEIATPAGYITSTVYGLLGPILLSVFAIATGTRLVAGQEEDGTLELELTAPIGRVQVLLERLGALWLNVAVLVGVLTLVIIALVAVLDLDVAIGNIVAGSLGLFLLILGFGTLALAVGAISGRRAIGLGAAAAFAVIAFMLDAIGPTIEAAWMTTVSPFSWYLEERPLFTGFDWQGLALLATVPLVAAVAGVARFARRDLMT
jgi:ABC-2 type transport system permease protein